RWWDHIGPLLANGWRVVALDLSGHGDSGRRDSYTLDTWAREVLAVAADAGITTAPTVIGHSMGGLVTLRLARPGRAPIPGARAGGPAPGARAPPPPPPRGGPPPRGPPPPASGGRSGRCSSTGPGRPP